MKNTGEYYSGCCIRKTVLYMTLLSVCGAAFLAIICLQPKYQKIWWLPLLMLTALPPCYYLAKTKRVTVDKTGITLRHSAQNKGFIAWEQVQTVALLKLANGEKLIVVSTRPEEEAVRSPFRRDLPLNEYMSVMYDRKCFECIRRCWGKDISEYHQ